MSNIVEIKVPNIGDFKNIPVIEVLVKPGDAVTKEDPLITLESDKATMDVPAPQSGVVKDIRVKTGDKVSEGSLILMLEIPPTPPLLKGGDTASPTPPLSKGVSAAPSSPPLTKGGSAAPFSPPLAKGGSEAGGFAGPKGDIHAEVLVLGAGPGGYTAAFRAADLGKKVVLVERFPTLGGVCLNVGCIPSKALLHVAKVIAEGQAMADHGVSFGAPQIDLDHLRDWKDGVVGKLTGGLAGMAKSRKVRVVHGEARFTGPHMLQVTGEEGTSTISFDHAIVAAGSRSVRLPGVPDDDPRVMDSTGALDLADIPERLLVIGGGIIGLEMATVYDALGSRVTVVELAAQLIPGCDPDLVRPLQKRIAGRYEAIHLSTSVEGAELREDGVHVTFSGDVEPALFDRVLVAVGRAPNGAGLGLESAGVVVDDGGFVAVDDQMRTNVAHIHAIGDIAGHPMLAHKATHEGHVAAEVIAGHDAAYDVRAMPSVAYTEPEVAWVGLTEIEAKARGTAYEKTVFPWSASGRALTMDGAAGLTKLLFDPSSRRVLGAGMVGTSAGDLVAEVGLAIEVGADVGDIALTVHAHPTLSETVGLAAELADGTITDLPNPAVKRRG